MEGYVEVVRCELKSAVNPMK